MAELLLNTSGALSSSLDQLTVHLDKLLVKRRSQIGYTSYRVDYEANAFTDVFDVFDSARVAHGPSKWGYAEADISGRKHSIGQSSSIAGKGPTDGTFAFLKGPRFFDFVMQADFIVSIEHFVAQIPCVCV